MTFAKNIFNFSRRYLILVLPTRVNLKVWNIIEDDSCLQCKSKSKTLHKVMANCPVTVSDRYKWRHDSVFCTILTHLANTVDASTILYVNIEGYQNPASPFHNSRPDIVVVKANVLFVLELTICLETNLLQSRDHKIHTYEHLKDDLINNELNTNLFSFRRYALHLSIPSFYPFASFV